MDGRVVGRLGGTASLLAAASLALSACDPAPTPEATQGPATVATVAPTPTVAPRAGGTIYVLTQVEQWNQVDPQRIYQPEEFAFFSATTMRSLTAFKVSPDPVEGTTLVPDMATDLGTTADGGRTWSFTIRPGVTWQDGTDVTCEDIKYGVSRTFAVEVINQGPTYAIADLDIPTDKDGASAYKGPYKVGRPAKVAGQDLYDKAVTCAGRTITFHLNRPIADFNAVVTLGFGAVRKADDTGETYGTVAPRWVTSNGPYQVESYTLGPEGSYGFGGKYTLARNPSWVPASDPYRKAYPDRWEVDFGVDPKVIDQRLMQSEGNDADAVMYGQVQPENLGTVYASPDMPTPPFVSRAASGFDPYARYLWIDVQRVPNVKIRQAMMVALDRRAILDIRGGEFDSTLADGVIKPTIGLDYAPTRIWDDYFGQPIADTGDATLARKLIAESGEAALSLLFKIPDTPTNARILDSVATSLGRAGIVVKQAPNCFGYGCLFWDQGAYAGDFGLGGWGADWPNASTVIPALFTMKGGWDLSKVDDPAFNAAVRDALETLDRAEQARKWQALNTRAVENAWVIPTTFSRQQRITGTKVAPAYDWRAYSSWPYPEMYVTP